jgi:hypothetical protein
MMFDLLYQLGNSINKLLIPFLLAAAFVCLAALAACNNSGTAVSSTTPVGASSTTLTSSSTIAKSVSGATSTTAVKNSITTAVSSTTQPGPVPSLNLEDYDGGFFSIEKPANWDLITAGYGSTLAFYIKDKATPANQIFYFNEVGPLYLAEEQKVVDKNYMDMGGYPVVWYEMPVIDPLTPENFLENFCLIARTDMAKKFMPDFPELTDVEVISTSKGISPISAGQTKTIRALFRQGGEIGEGLFYITVAPVIPLTGMPSGGIGYGFCCTGVTAVKSDFRYYQDSLIKSLNSLNISQAYIDSCLAQQQQQYQGILKAGRTLSETSDIIMDTWENRNRSDDIISEKRSDAILGYDRVYDPETGTVYEVPLGFYDDYNIDREHFRMDNLQQLPDNDWNLWTSPTESADKID